MNIVTLIEIDNNSCVHLLLNANSNIASILLAFFYRGVGVVASAHFTEKLLFIFIVFREVVI